MAPLLPIGIAVLAGLAYLKVRNSKKGELTAEKQIVYETAMTKETNPEKFRALAEAFREEGFEPQAEMLEKRAELHEAPPEVKAARKEAFEAGMRSENAEGVRNLANAFEGQAATGAAQALNKYADGLEMKAQIEAVAQGKAPPAVVAKASTLQTNLPVKSALSALKPAPKKTPHFDAPLVPPSRIPSAITVKKK